MIGVVKLNKALEMAESIGLDLVEVSPNAKPPVCKILDYGKFKFEAQKKAAKAKKKQKVIEIKEIKFRPNIDTNDFNVKIKSVIKFLSAGDKVKITMRYRGREMAHRELGIKILDSGSPVFCLKTKKILFRNECNSKNFIDISASLIRKAKNKKIIKLLTNFY